MQLSLNNQQMVHILSEVIVFIGITFYFSTRIKYIEKKMILQNNRINDLENMIEQQGKVIKMILHKFAAGSSPNPVEEEAVEENSLKNRQSKLVEAVKKNKNKKVKEIKVEPKIEEIIDEEEVDEEEVDEEEVDEEEVDEEEVDEEDEDLKDEEKLVEMLENEINDLK